MTMNVCWRVTQRGVVLIVTVNSTTLFTDTTDPYMLMMGVGIGVILEVFMPLFVTTSTNRMFTKLLSSTRIIWTL